MGNLILLLALRNCFFDKFVFIQERDVMVSLSNHECEGLRPAKQAKRPLRTSFDEAQDDPYPQ
jgi:hypothetical protein